MKRFIAFALIVTLILTVTSCADMNTDKETTDPLSIYILDYDLYLKDAISSFNTREKTKAISEKIFYNDQYEEYSKQLQTELFSGSGPDIIAIPAGLLPNLSKYIIKGAFCNLDELIGKDKDFKHGDYNDQVLDSGAVNGGRYFIPLSYTLNALYTTKEIIDAYKIDSNKKYLSLDDIAGMATRFASLNPGNGKYLMDGFTLFDSGIAGLPDALYGKANFDTVGFARMMDQYKGLSGVLCPPDKLAAYGGNDLSKRLKSGEVAYLRYPVGGFRMLADPYSAFETEVVPELCALSLTGGNQSVSASPYEIVAINANCKDKEKAFRFVKQLLSEDLQKNSYIYGLPVNKAAFESQKEEFIKGSLPTGGVTKSESMEKLAQELDELVKGKVSCGLIDSDALIAMNAEFHAFTDGEKSSADAADSIRQKLSEYGDKELQTAKATGTASPAVNKEVAVLTINYMDNDLAVKNAIRAFGEKRQDVKIEGNVFPIGSKEEYATKLTTGIMAGEGPDILYYKPEMFNSLRKTMQTGVFCDLNELIAKDDTFKNLDLNKAVMDSGVYEGKRYYIPTEYFLPLLVSTKGILDKNGININDNWTVDDFKKVVTDYANRSGNKYFFSYNMNFILLLDAYGKDFIDYKSKTTHFQSQEFIDLLKLGKDLSPTIMPYDAASDAEPPVVLMKNGKFVMDFEDRSSPEEMWMGNSIYKEVFGEDLVLYPLPAAAGVEGNSVTIRDVVSINATCRSKEAAFDFIEELLSENCQMAYDQHGNTNIIMGFQANQQALRKDLDYFVKTAPDWPLFTGTRTFASKSLPQSLAQRMTDLNIRIVGAIGRDQAVNGIINEGLQSFIDGKRTAEQAAKDIDDKVKLFLNE